MRGPGHSYDGLLFSNHGRVWSRIEEDLAATLVSRDYFAFITLKFREFGPLLRFYFLHFSVA